MNKVHKQPIYKNFNTYLSEDQHTHVKETFKELNLQISISDDFDANVLDAGCATGALIGYLKLLHPNWKYTGIDISDDLINIAKQKLVDVELFQGSVLEYPEEFYGQFDLIVCSGVLGVFDEEDAMKFFSELLKCAKPNGEIIVLSQFNKFDADIQITHRKYNSQGKDNGWEKGFNNYSMKTIQKWLRGKVRNIEFADFHMPIDIDKKDDVVRTWTVEIDNERRLTNGLKLIVDLMLLKINV